MRRSAKGIVVVIDDQVIFVIAKIMTYLAIAVKTAEIFGLAKAVNVSCLI